MFQFERHALENFLQSLDYPMSKSQMLQRANRSSLPHQVVSLLQRLDDHQYASADEVESDLAMHKA